jgi:Arc/MetJ-type ribon-helix-helix transcriptional regulator
MSYSANMKTLTIRLPDVLVNQIEQESQARRVSKSDIVRERLAALPPARATHPLADILAEIDRAPVTGRRRNGARDKKRLPEIIRAHYRAAKRHY